MSEQWYEFEQIETFTRPFFVKARTAAEAKKATEGVGVVGVPDLATQDMDIRIIGRGKLVREPGMDAYLMDRAAELRRQPGPRHRPASTQVSD